MVDGTPVLDIKPYIPQYDYPGIAQLHIRDTCDISRRTMCDIGVERNNEDINQQDTMNERVMDGEENGHVMNQMVPESSRYVKIIIMILKFICYIQISSKYYFQH